MAPGPELSELAVHRTMIENTLCRYAWAFDMANIDLLEGCFTHAAEVQFQDGFRSGRSAVLAELARRRDAYAAEQTPWHLITNVYVRPESPTRARVASWFSFGAMQRDKPAALTSFGWYDDIFVLEEDDWRIAHRRVLRPYER